MLEDTNPIYDAIIEEPVSLQEKGGTETHVSVRNRIEEGHAKIAAKCAIVQVNVPQPAAASEFLAVKSEDKLEDTSSAPVQPLTKRQRHERAVVDPYMLPDQGNNGP